MRHGGLIQRKEGRDGLQSSDHSEHRSADERCLRCVLLRLQGFRQRCVFVAVFFVRMIGLIVPWSGIFMVVAGDAVWPVTMVNGGDFHHATAVTDIPAHHPKHLRPTDRKECDQADGESL